VTIIDQVNQDITYWERNTKEYKKARKLLEKYCPSILEIEFPGGVSASICSTSLSVYHRLTNPELVNGWSHEIQKDYIKDIWAEQGLTWNPKPICRERSGDFMIEGSWKLTDDFRIEATIKLNGKPDGCTLEKKTRSEIVTYYEAVCEEDGIIVSK